MKKVFVSACLMGQNCRFDCVSVKSEEAAALANDHEIIMACPEELGGLPSPRPRCEMKDGAIIGSDGADYTKEYLLGAQNVLKICQYNGIGETYLKSNSPSCGCGKIYDGTFSGKLVDGEGLTATLLKKHGIKVNSL